jgi:hypothetical protein
MVPTSADAERLDAAALRIRWEGGVSRFRELGVEEPLLRERSMVTPSCGMGSLSTELAEKVLRLLANLSQAVGG